MDLKKKAFASKIELHILKKMIFNYLLKNQSQVATQLSNLT